MTDKVLWEAEGMVHRISVMEVSDNGTALVQVSRIRGGTWESATLTPTERFELAKALYPEAFTNSPEPLKEEFGVRDHNGCLAKDRAYLNRRIANLIHIEDDETLVTRKVTPWVETSQTED